MEKVIAFVGDSFCSSYSHDYRFREKYQDYQLYKSAYPNLIADHFKYGIAAYGFRGRSWWHSWCKFDQAWATKLEQLEAIVFCHTNSDRINSMTHEYLPHQPHSFNNSVSEELSGAVHLYFKFVHDVEFNEWAQQQYFKMIKEKFSGVKTIHLHGMPGSIDYAHLLPGMSFNTALSVISVGEIVGSKDTVDRSFQDSRPNHLSEQNNRVLAEIIIDALENYSPGQYELPIERFYQPNANGKNWPHGKYWST